ncbi:Ig-like domain-containing protein [Caldicoprobacter algeriensis]|uniref:Ig-like domain-containing protein n=1 Tax=Caldicoprobacter algeriensis TaxID=699281 RepID=UPI00207A9080|nr:SBBP repeat-containing protein [Caldicoprobacter algeriensis]
MKIISYSLTIALFFSLIVISPPSWVHAATGSQSSLLNNDNKTITSNLNLHGITIPFIKNSNSKQSEVKYYATTFYGTVYITNNAIIHRLYDGDNDTILIKEQFLDAEGNPIVFESTGMQKSNIKADLYIGKNPDKWQTALETWNIISLGEIYPGIEVTLKAHGGNIEKIFKIKPGANPSDIKIRVIGQDKIELKSNGYLNLKSSIGDIYLTKPVAFQDNNTIDVMYKLSGNIYTFQVGTYNPNKELIIDPKLEYSTYIGGTEGDHMEGTGIRMAVDAEGNVYIAGSTRSADFPITEGAYQDNMWENAWGCAYISKLMPNGEGKLDLKYSTYFGAVAFIEDITVDKKGNIYIAGYGVSNDFPIADGAYQTDQKGGTESWVVKLKPNSQGTLDIEYSTYIGGSDYDYVQSLAVDNEGNIYLAGTTWSSDFPITEGAYQNSPKGEVPTNFIAKLAPQHQGKADLIYSTYFGGSENYYKNDYINDITVDTQGNIYITGETNSEDFPVTDNAYQTSLNGYEDIFIAILTPNGQGMQDLKYSTYFGGSEFDVGLSITLDNYNNIYLTGITHSNDFPVTKGAFQSTRRGEQDDIFVVKFKPNQQGTLDLKYSSYIGGIKCDFSYSIAVDSEGNIYLTGGTESHDFPVTDDAHQKNYNGGNYDAFIIKLAPNGQDSQDLKYSTYFGGTGDDIGYGIALNIQGDIFIAGITLSEDLPITEGAYQTDYHGGYDEREPGEGGNFFSGDAFIAKLSQKPKNAAPVAADDTAKTDQGTSAIIKVLDNDSDPDNDTLTITNITQPKHGKAEINSNGTITYTPESGFSGDDFFTYTISDGKGGEATANVKVTVNKVNSPPKAVNDTAETKESTSVTINVLANDLDPDNDTLAVITVTEPKHGKVTYNKYGIVTYTPESGFSGDDSFTYTVSDGNGGEATANVKITVSKTIEPGTYYMDINKISKDIEDPSKKSIYIDLTNIISASNKRTVEIPFDVIELMVKNNKTTIVKSQEVALQFDTKALAALKNVAHISQQAAVKISIQDKGKMAESSLIPLTNAYDITVKVEEQDINIGAPIKVTFDLKDVKDITKAAVFYFNPETSKWEYIGGEIDKSQKTITFIAEHFSVYGVFEYIGESEQSSTFEEKDKLVQTGSWLDIKTFSIIGFFLIITGILVVLLDKKKYKN